MEGVSMNVDDLKEWLDDEYDVETDDSDDSEDSEPMVTHDNE